MQKVWAFVQRLWKALTGDPVLLALVVAFIFFTSFVFIELFRASSYKDAVYDFQQSAQVQNMLSVASAMNTNAERDGLSIQCDLDIDTVFIEAPDEKNVDNLDYVNKESQELLRIKPSFTSPAVFLDGVQSSRSMSNDIEISLNEIERLSRENVKATYCEELSNVLGKAFFLRELETTAGVNALLVGQIENYWVNLDTVVSSFNEIKRVPADFADQHAEVSESLSNLTAAIRTDTRDVESFSEDIGAEMDQIRGVFLQLKAKSPELEELLSTIQIMSEPLNIE